MNHENDTDPATPSSRHKAAPVAGVSSGLGTGTDPGIGGAPRASDAAPGQPFVCPPPSNRPQVPSPPVTQPRLPLEGSTSPAPAPARIAAVAGTPLPPAGSNDSMDVLLEAIGSQDKPFVPKRTSASAGERSASYEGQARAVPPATTDPTPGPSVIVTLPDPMPPAITKKIARSEVDSALKLAGAASLPKRAENTTIVVDPPGPSNKLLRWTVAGVLIAACFVGAAGIHNAVEKAREARAGAGATTAAPVGVNTDEHVEAPRTEPPSAPPAAAVVADREPVEAAPVRAPAPEPTAKKLARGARGAKVPSGLEQTEASQAAAASVAAPAAVTPPKKPKPNVPGLEDLKTEY